MQAQKPSVTTIEIRIFLNHIYEYKKGIRNMVLYTMSNEYEEYAVRRLKNQKIPYIKQIVTSTKINLFFGKQEYLDVVKMFVNKPLNKLTPEEDFMLGTMLGYDICRQCERFCEKKQNASSFYSIQ